MGITAGAPAPALPAIYAASSGYPSSVMKRIKEKFLSKYDGENHVVRQKAFVLFIACLVFVPLLVVPIVINILAAVSSQPVVINILNALFLAMLIASLFLLWNGRYAPAVTIFVIIMLVRVVGGVAVKIEDLALTGSNNNVYFIFASIVFTSLFGGRSLLAVVTVAYIIISVGMIPVVAGRYPGANMNHLYGSTMNVVIAIISVAVMSRLIASITEKLFRQRSLELEENRALSGNLAAKVRELEAMNEELGAMNEEMESMNEELSSTYHELLEANREIGIFKKFVEEAGQGFCMTDMEGVLTYANAAILRIIGREEREAVIGTGTRDYYSKESREKIKNEIMPRVLKEGQWQGELPILNSRGEEVPTLQNVFFIRDEKGAPVQVATIVSDITEMKKLEERLTRANKMEALGRLTGGIAHDYNNILTAILGYSQLLKSKTEPDDPRAGMVDEIIKAGNISAGITRQLLAFGKNQYIRPKVMDLNESIRNLEKMLRRFTGESIELVLRLGPNVRAIYADPAQIDQVVLNLAINSCDAMPAAGTLVIETGNADMDAGAAGSVPDARAGAYAYVSIEDTGVGMDKERMDHMFDPFYSTKNTGKGTGLGLSVVYGIVKQHGGWINVSSEPGKGTSVRVFVPAAPGEAAPETSGPEMKKDLAGKGERILLVEDNRSVRAFASRVLADHGYSVTEAEDADGALSRFNSEGGNVDLLLSDVVLPGKNGIRLAEELTALNPRLKVLLCSGYTGQRSQIDSIMERNYPFLQKPYSMNDLLLGVRDALECN